MLVAALKMAKPGETILVVGLDQDVDLLLFEAIDALAKLESRRGVKAHLARGPRDESYSRRLFHRGLLDLERGMRAEADQKQPGTTLCRNRTAVLGLVGGYGTTTGTVQFLNGDISVNPNDHAAYTKDDYPLSTSALRSSPTPPTL